MSLQNITRELHNLTFTEMLELSKKLQQLMNVEFSPQSIAESLLLLEFKPGQLEENQKREEQLLAKAFSRKRTISVVLSKGQVANSWHVDCSTLPGSKAHDLTLRGCFPKMLDQIITMEALSG